MKMRIDLKNRTWLAGFMVIVMNIITLPAVIGQELEKKQAMIFIGRDQTSKAVAEMNKAVAAYPEEASLLYYLGYAQIKNGKPEEAMKTFEKGIAKDPKEALNYAGKGYAQFITNKTAEAKASFDQALSMSKSKDPAVLKAVAEAYLTNTKNAAEALSLLQNAKSRDSKDFWTNILLGDAYLAQNNGGSAVSSYENAAMLDPKNGLPHYKIGLVYMRSKNMAAAEEALNKAISVDPDFTLAHKELGEYYYVRKDGPAAVKAYENYLRLTERPEEGKLRYAFFLFMAKDFAKANKVFEELSKKPDVTPVTLRYYAYSLYESGNLAKAQTVFENYFQKADTADINAGDYAYLGQLLLKQGKDSLAIVNFQKSIALDKNQPEILELTGETAFKNKYYPIAADAYKELVAQRKTPLSQDYYMLGRAYYLSEKYLEADTAFQKLIEKQPNMVVSYLWGARTKSHLDPESDSGLAKPFYEKVIEKAAPEKNKNELIEAYSYLGYYHILKGEAAVSKSYWEKVLTLNPDDTKAKEAIKAILNN